MTIFLALLENLCTQVVGLVSGLTHIEKIFVYMSIILEKRIAKWVIRWHVLSILDLKALMECKWIEINWNYLHECVYNRLRSADLRALILTIPYVPLNRCPESVTEQIFRNLWVKNTYRFETSPIQDNLKHVNLVSKIRFYKKPITINFSWWQLAIMHLAVSSFELFEKRCDL